MDTLTMEIRALDAWDDAALAAFHATYHAADVHGREHAAPWMLEEMRADLRGSRTGERFACWTGVVDPATDPGPGGVVSCGMLVLPMKDNLDLAIVRVWTRPESRRRGYGSAMLDHVVAAAAAAGRITLVSEAHVPFEAPEDGVGYPDPDFAYSRGWGFDMCDVVRVLPLPVDDGRLSALGEQAAPHHADYTLRQFKGPVPDDIVEEFGRLVGSLMVEAPSGAVALEEEVLDVERIRADEAVFAAAGRTKYTTVAVARDGSVVAYSELVVPAFDPGAIFQWGTLVDRGHRGHRLGMATKVANLRWVQREAPDRDRVYTMNAEVNQQMIGINEALGFLPVERHVSLHRRLA
ncbi:MAG TPA: GNAT family N-acetyltransferase [Nocardioides sp.]|uniref:GNAT family N-acetyltransferase n=1 Tax=Nocardioides sp. TaxID=35761 RepID=UPI002D7F8CA5|nr:GNAT family N-acetyltransferase [Nocardioides sp.]HET6652054.1 GNAT family N-acetyltransferase [Nocardioides sp.]